MKGSIRGQAVILNKEGLSLSQIRVGLWICRSPVRRAPKHFLETESVVFKVESDRPEVTIRKYQYTALREHQIHHTSRIYQVNNP